MKPIALLIIVLTFFGSVRAQEGVEFPMLIGQTLDETVVDLPDRFKGKYSLIGLAYSKKCEEDFNSWVGPVYNKFIAKTGMMDDLWDVNVAFVPMFTGVKKGAMDKVMENMKARSSKEIFPYVVFYKGDADPYVSNLKMKDKNLFYVYVLDPEGRIVYSSTGKYNSGKMDKIESKLAGE